jgi:hypothetical protein
MPVVCRPRAQQRADAGRAGAPVHGRLRHVSRAGPAKEDKRRRGGGGTSLSEVAFWMRSCSRAWTRAVRSFCTSICWHA